MSAKTPLPDAPRAGSLAAQVNTADVHAPASNTAAVITYAAPGAGFRHVLSGVAWSYDADPTAGSLTITDGGNTIFKIAVTNKGPGFIPFDPPKMAGDNAALVITLAAGGSGITGVVNALGHWVSL